MKKIFIKTWGCQMNEYDSSLIVSLLTYKNNYQLTEKSEKADILILNTCSIREKAQEKLFHQLGRWKKLKIIKPELIIAVGGCVAAQEGKNLYKRANYINIIFGTQSLYKLPYLIKKYIESKKLVIDINFYGLDKYDHPSQIIPSQTSALVSIMEGCNKYCSFCIVPYTRGREISRSSESILLEIECLAKKGVKEITLLGQNVNSYLRRQNSNKQFCNFAQLLKKISTIQEIKRIKFITSHPINFNDDIIKLYQSNNKLSNLLHLPVQSGSNKILRLMKRGYDINFYKNIIYKLKQVRPTIQISSDFIVGFPGETNKDFQDTMDLISEINFDMSFSFLYSPRPGTKASKLKDNISLEEKKARLYMLQKKILYNTISWSRKMIGSTQLVLVEGISKKNVMKLCGKTENNRTVHFVGHPKLIGKIVKVNITNVHYHHLNGDLALSEKLFN